MASIQRQTHLAPATGRLGLVAGFSLLLTIAVVPILFSHRVVAGWLSLMIVVFGLGVCCGRYAGELQPSLQRWQQAKLARRAQKLNRTTPPS